MADECLPRLARLRRAKDFTVLFERARSFRRGDFAIRCLENHHGHARLGIVVAKKKAKRAVVRNRIKRTVRESFRKHHGELPSKDYMVIYRGTQQPIDAPALRETLLGFWRQEVIYYR